MISGQCYSQILSQQMKVGLCIIIWGFGYSLYTRQQVAISVSVSVYCISSSCSYNNLCIISYTSACIIPLDSRASILVDNHHLMNMQQEHLDRIQMALRQQFHTKGLRERKLYALHQNAPTIENSFIAFKTSTSESYIICIQN